MTIIYTDIYTKFTRIDHLKVEIVHILVIIAAVTQIHGNCQKSRYKAKITVITVIVNSWFTYIPSDNYTRVSDTNHIETTIAK